MKQITNRIQGNIANIIAMLEALSTSIDTAVEEIQDIQDGNTAPVCVITIPAPTASDKTLQDRINKCVYEEIRRQHAEEECLFKARGM